MAQTITRLFNSHAEAVAAVRELEASGVKDKNISLVANNTEGWHGDEKGESTDHSDAGEGAGKGAGTGAVLGGGAGLLAGLGMLAIPGIGPIVAAGWLGSTLLGAGVGAVAGGAVGGLVGALTDSGESEENAQIYAEGVRRGGSLVSVRVDDPADAMRVTQTLEKYHGTDAASRGARYRESGWSGYNSNAPAYTRDEIARERSAYVITADGERRPL